MFDIKCPGFLYKRDPNGVGHSAWQRIGSFNVKIMILKQGLLDVLGNYPQEMVHASPGHPGFIPIHLTQHGQDT